MENKQYEQLLNSFPEEHRKKVKEFGDYIERVLKGTYSHYLNNNIQGPLGYIQLYLGGLSEKEQFDEEAKEIQSGLRKAGAILGVLLHTPLENMSIGKDNVADLDELLNGKTDANNGFKEK